MVASPKPARDSGDGDDHRLFTQTLHECEAEGGDGVPEEILAEHDEGRLDVRGMGSCRENAR